MKTKHLSIILLCMIGLIMSSYSCSESDKKETKISVEALPELSKQFLSDYFYEADIEEVLQSADEYIVSLYATDAEALKSTRPGYKITFDRKGNWKEIKSRTSLPLPPTVLTLIPRTILSYLDQNYPERGIKEIEKETYGFDVELTNKPEIELKFDKDGTLISKTGDKENDKVITYELLPTDAKTFLQNHFGKLTPSKIEKDNDSYDVKYPSNIEVEFDLKGNWIEVDINRGTMPQTVINLLPAQIETYLKANYPSRKVEEIKNKLNTYEIELQVDLKLTFDKAGNIWSSTDTGNTDTGNKRITFVNLPQTIQTLLNTHFLSTTKFMFAEKENNKYEIKLRNGTELEFALDGTLKSVEVVPGNHVPDAIINASVLTYVKSKYPNKKIEEYEVKTTGFKVELSGYPEIEMLFDANGNFKKFD